MAFFLRLLELGFLAHLLAQVIKKIMISKETQSLIRALIRGLKYTVSLLVKVLEGEDV